MPVDRTSEFHVPLPLEDEHLIRSVLADIDDPSLCRELDGRFRRRLQGQANHDAKLRRYFREALEEAQENGYGDPVAFASARSKGRALVDHHNKRCRAILSRAHGRISAKADRVSRRTERAAKSAKPSLRRQPSRDRQYLEIIGQAERSRVPGTLVVPEITLKMGRYRPPSWEKSSPCIRLLAASIVSANRGARTINLRVSGAVGKAALASRRGCASYIQDRIRRELILEFGKDSPVDFWLVIESDFLTRFHVHGAFIPPDQLDATDRVNRALRRAGGEWRTRQDKQQVDRLLTDPIWWASYVTKHLALTAAKIDRRLVAMSEGMQRMAKKDWGATRMRLPAA